MLTNLSIEVVSNGYVLHYSTKDKTGLVTDFCQLYLDQGQLLDRVKELLNLTLATEEPVTPSEE